MGREEKREGKGLQGEPQSQIQEALQGREAAKTAVVASPSNTVALRVP